MTPMIPMGTTAPYATVYWCENCKAYFGVPRGPRMSCAVMHAPGSCCHEYEQRLWVASGELADSLSKEDAEKSEVS
jgi:hypothetical protein